MRLPDGFLDELRTRTPLAAIIGRRVKLVRSGRQWKGCCPFHNEKTPSFYVYDDGYKCFGCGEHGDAVTFVRKTQGLGFMEAVELLAGEAGMEVPKPSAAAVEADRRQTDLRAVLDAAAASFQRRLRLPEGAGAMAYLRNRGLSDETIARFGLGWSGEGRGALAADLGRQGIEPALLVDAGLMRAGEEGRPPADLFFNRVMFPIRDRRGRVKSFGGRILGDGQPKYVNGPETTLFSKRRTLFGLDIAAQTVIKGADLVVVEGYMDVIALHQAGFAGAVAPLGTALTEEQLEALWRLSPMPVLCFDGDAAGARAALRALDLGLPRLTPEASLRIATLPAADDPDSLVRRQGAAAFRAVLDAAKPASEALYDLMAHGVGPAPEQRAGLRARLEAAASRVEDRTLGREVRRALLDRFFAESRRPGPGRGAPTKRAPGFVRPVPSQDAAARQRGRILLAILLRHPWLIEQVDEQLAVIDLPASMAALRAELHRCASSHPPLDSEALISHLHAAGYADICTEMLQCSELGLRSDSMPAEVAAAWWHFFGLLDPGRLDEEVTRVARAFNASDGDPVLLNRLVALSNARSALQRGMTGGEDLPEPPAA